MLWTGYVGFQKVLSPYKRDTEWHNERFHGSTSIVLQEAPQLTTPPVFSSNDKFSTPHSPSAMLYLTCQRHPRRPYCRQQAPRPTFCANLTLSLPARFWPSGDLLSQTTLAHFFFGRLLFRPVWTTSTRSDLRETSVTNFTFSLAVFFC